MIVMSSENDSNRIKRFISFTVHVNCSPCVGGSLDISLRSLFPKIEPRFIFSALSRFMFSPDLFDRLSCRCLAEGAEEFLIKPVKMEDVKRLQGHIRSSASSSESSESSNSSTRVKRKSPEGLELYSPERRTRTAERLS